jgi:hypothetical protein
MFSKRKNPAWREKCFVSLLFLAAFLLVLSQAEPLKAQVPGILGMPKLYAEFKIPQVGAYVKYRLIDDKTKSESILKMSIVGKEKLEGKEFFWYEFDQTDSKGGNENIFKLLISGNPQQRGTIKRMIYKSGKDPANELPQAFMNLINQSPIDTAQAVKPRTKKMGTEKITTKVGTFSCVRTQDLSADNVTTDTWTSSQIPLYGIVKSTSGSTKLELLEYGTGAVSAIKEKPRLLEMPGEK